MDEEKVNSEKKKKSKWVRKQEPNRGQVKLNSIN